MSAPAAYDVHVSGIAPQTSEQHLLDFFTYVLHPPSFVVAPSCAHSLLLLYRFCGKIASIDFDASAKSAVIHFEKASAAKTALMLNGGTLDGAQLSVTSPTEHHDPESAEANHPDTPIDQTDKPRAGIAAEYLAKGYVLSDGILQRAIELDNQRGISKRFLSYFQSIDSTLGQKALGPDQKISAKVAEKLYQAQEQAKTIDQQKGITTKAGDVRCDLLLTSMRRLTIRRY